MLARYWVREICEIEAMWHFAATSGSYEIRMKPYANRRLEDLVDAGLMEVSEIQALFADIRKELRIPPFATGPESDATHRSNTTFTI